MRRIAPKDIVTHAHCQCQTANANGERTVSGKTLITVSLLDIHRRMKLDWAFAIQPYGEAWRARRRIFQSAFDAKSSRQYRPYQISARNHVINRLLDSPGQWDSHFR